MTKIWLKLQLHFSQKTTTKTKLKSAVKINTDTVFLHAVLHRNA